MYTIQPRNKEIVLEQLMAVLYCKKWLGKERMNLDLETVIIEKDDINSKFLDNHSTSELVQKYLKEEEKGLNLYWRCQEDFPNLLNRMTALQTFRKGMQICIDQGWKTTMDYVEAASNNLEMECSYSK